MEFFQHRTVTDNYNYLSLPLLLQGFTDVQSGASYTLGAYYNHSRRPLFGIIPPLNQFKLHQNGGGIIYYLLILSPPPPPLNQTAPTLCASPYGTDIYFQIKSNISKLLSN